MATPIVGSLHNHYQLEVEGLAVELDVLSFQGEEWLSQPFKYTVAFTSMEQDIDAAQILGKDASFHLGASRLTAQLPIPQGGARTLHGVITGFKRVSGSRDEARYEVTLEARLALLGRGKQYRIYQHQSVPEKGVHPMAQEDTITINLGRYRGLQLNPCRREVQHVAYAF